MPIYDQINGEQGNNLEFRVVRWGVVKIIDSSWNGNSSNTWVKVQKNFTYNGELRAKTDLSAPAMIDGAYTSPVLVE